MFALGASAGCTRTPVLAETSDSLCTNEVDDDGDLLGDCADPDCWGHEVCRVPSVEAGVLPPPYEAPWMEPPPDDDDIPTPADERPDAGALPEPIDSGTPIEPVDSGTVAPPPPACGGLCPIEECIEGECVQPPTPLGRYVVSSLEVEVPRGRRLANGGGCWDANDECGMELSLACECSPDPQVKLFVDDVKAGHAGVAPESELATWDALSIELDLNQGSRIRLEVLDNDEDVPEAPDFEIMFECELLASAELLASGELKCEEELGFPPVGQPRRVVAYIEPVETPEE
jgi:hypothetical protein